MTAKDNAAYWAYALGWGTVRRMPEKTAYRTFDRLADRLWSRRAGGVAQLEKNLTRVVPGASESQLRELSRQGTRSYFRYWCDAFRMPDWSNEKILRSLHCDDLYRLEQALTKNTGAIVALCHMGNWDHAGAWGSIALSPVSSVAEKLEPERLFQRFVAYRESLGMRIYPLGQQDVMDRLASDLTAENRIVALVSDRDLTARGIEVSFFGEPTRMPAGAASLALRTGATLLPATLWYEGPMARIRMHPEVVPPMNAPRGDTASKQPGYSDAVSRMTQQIAHAFEEGIANHPTDWHMMQKLWLADLDPARLAASDAAGDHTELGR